MQPPGSSTSSTEKRPTNSITDSLSKFPTRIRSDSQGKSINVIFDRSPRSPKRGRTFSQKRSETAAPNYAVSKENESIRTLLGLCPKELSTEFEKSVEKFRDSKLVTKNLMISELNTSKEATKLFKQIVQGREPLQKYSFDLIIWSFRMMKSEIARVKYYSSIKETIKEARRNFSEDIGQLLAPILVNLSPQLFNQAIAYYEMQNTINSLRLSLQTKKTELRKSPGKIENLLAEIDSPRTSLKENKENKIIELRSKLEGFIHTTTGIEGYLNSQTRRIEKEFYNFIKTSTSENTITEIEIALIRKFVSLRKKDFIKCELDKLESTKTIKKVLFGTNISELITERYQKKTSKKEKNLILLKLKKKWNVDSFEENFTILTKMEAFKKKSLLQIKTHLPEKNITKAELELITQLINKNAPLETMEKIKKARGNSALLNRRNYVHIQFQDENENEKVALVEIKLKKAKKLLITAIPITREKLIKEQYSAIKNKRKNLRKKITMAEEKVNSTKKLKKVLAQINQENIHYENYFELSKEIRTKHSCDHFTFVEIKWPDKEPLIVLMKLEFNAKPHDPFLKCSPRLSDLFANEFNLIRSESENLKNKINKVNNKFVKKATKMDEILNAMSAEVIKITREVFSNCEDLSQEELNSYLLSQIDKRFNEREKSFIVLKVKMNLETLPQQVTERIKHVSERVEEMVKILKSIYDQKKDFSDLELQSIVNSIIDKQKNSSGIKFHIKAFKNEVENFNEEKSFLEFVLNNFLELSQTVIEGVDAVSYEKEDVKDKALYTARLTELGKKALEHSTSFLKTVKALQGYAQIDTNLTNWIKCIILQSLESENLANLKMNKSFQESVSAFLFLMEEKANPALRLIIGNAISDLAEMPTLKPIFSKILNKASRREDRFKPKEIWENYLLDVKMNTLYPENWPPRLIHTQTRSIKTSAAIQSLLEENRKEASSKILEQIKALREQETATLNQISMWVEKAKEVVRTSKDIQDPAILKIAKWHLKEQQPAHLASLKFQQSIEKHEREQTLASHQTVRHRNPVLLLKKKNDHGTL